VPSLVGHALSGPRLPADIDAVLVKGVALADVHAEGLEFGFEVSDSHAED
jgi:hypothetical protein